MIPGMAVSDITSIRRRARHSEISQERLARALQMDRSWLSRILSGQQRPPSDFAARAFRALRALEDADQAADRARAESLRRAGVSA